MVQEHVLDLWCTVLHNTNNPSTGYSNKLFLTFFLKINYIKQHEIVFETEELEIEDRIICKNLNLKNKTNCEDRCYLINENVCAWLLALAHMVHFCRLAAAADHTKWSFHNEKKQHAGTTKMPQYE